MEYNKDFDRRLNDISYQLGQIVKQFKIFNENIQEKENYNRYE